MRKSAEVNSRSDRWRRDDGLVVYGTGVSRELGELIAAEIARLSDKPVRAVVYSHHHADHCQGTDAIVSPAAVANGEVEVIAWSSFSHEYRDEWIDQRCATREDLSVCCGGVIHLRHPSIRALRRRWCCIRFIAE